MDFINGRKPIDASIETPSSVDCTMLVFPSADPTFTQPSIAALTASGEGKVSDLPVNADMTAAIPYAPQFDMVADMSTSTSVDVRLCLHRKDRRTLNRVAIS